MLRRPPAMTGEAIGALIWAAIWFTLVLLATRSMHRRRRDATTRAPRATDAGDGGRPGGDSRGDTPTTPVE